MSDLFTDVRLSDLDYSYPFELVAQHPLKKREASRMLVLDKKSKTWSHQKFLDFPDYFSEGDVIVLNDSKVFPCRLLATKELGGRVEFLLFRETRPKVWACLISGSKKVPKGSRIVFSEKLSGEVLDDPAEVRHIRLDYGGELFTLLDEIGHVPLPPYIKRKEDFDLDRERYQTTYASKIGSVAAPTAGFHFTDAIFKSLSDRGVQVCFVTLHVGIGTFLPVRQTNISDHHMHGEHYAIPETTASAINKAKSRGAQVCAVGTTTVRTLESAWHDSCGLKSGEGYTERFIYSPYRFRVIDRLLTNFHQPRSTLLALVMALASRELILQAYNGAISRGYRFFSYGDCMLI